MRILIHTDEYYPTAAACAYRMKVLADVFIAAGHDVIVIASSTNKEKGKIEKQNEKILYSPAVRMKKKTTIMRMINNCSFGISSIFTSLRTGNIDVVITTSPPPLVSIPGWIISKIKHAKLVYDVRDVWPDVALEMGSFSSKSIYYKVFKWISNFMYRYADLITTVSPGKVKKLQKYVKEIDKVNFYTDKVRLISNGFDENILNSSFDEQLVMKYQLDEKFTCVYVGNIGLAQGLDKLLDIAAHSRHHEIQFLCFGTGAELEQLSQRVKDEKIENVYFCGVLPHEKVYTLLSAAKISFISLKSADMKDSIPTKVYEALGIGCPVFLIAEGDSCEIVNETKMGKCISPNKIYDIVTAFDDMIDNYEQYKKQRETAKIIMKNKYSRQKIAENFEKNLKEWIKNQ